jgi:4-hydroxy-tetrahydrodipicolinate synthase
MPRETHDLVEEFFKGNIEKAKEMQLNMMSLIDLLFIENNPIPVKTALNLMGFEMGELRKPLFEMEENNLSLLKEELKRRGLVTE